MAMNSTAQTTADVHSSGVMYIGVGRESLLFCKLEAFVNNKHWGQTLINMGYGWAPGSEEDGIYAFHSLHTELGHTFGIKRLFLHVGLEPALNFQHKVTFIDLNGVLALRYQNSSTARKFGFLELGYLPKLYTTHQRGVNGSINCAIGFTF